MTRIGTDEAGFNLLVASAHYGAHINLTSAQYRLSEAQVVDLLNVIAATRRGKLVLRRGDYDDNWLLIQAITFPTQLVLT